MVMRDSNADWTVAGMRVRWCKHYNAIRPHSSLGYRSGPIREVHRISQSSVVVVAEIG